MIKYSDEKFPVYVKHFEDNQYKGISKSKKQFVYKKKEDLVIRWLNGFKFATWYKDGVIVESCCKTIPPVNIWDEIQKILGD